ncbi:uncharacterized protein LOC62_07G009560 [Vanrija pseudolonga]|uniref:Uncharacterized protein n=1 Tax=Vanrija pseudolonga TaxID=143232 RepID=A0AAF0YIX1_9TREE|nr:hypothetical protein LOC62_07G009560 [Vanrija pseudolonga]
MARLLLVLTLLLSCALRALAEAASQVPHVPIRPSGLPHTPAVSGLLTKQRTLPAARRRTSPAP